MKKLLPMIVALLGFTLFAEPSFHYNFHEPMFIFSQNGVFKNKNIPNDNIRAFGFETPIHVYMKITITTKDSKYSSDIIPYYGGTNTYLTPYVSTAQDKNEREQSDLGDFIDNMIKTNKIKKTEDVVIDIDFVSNDFTKETATIYVKNHDFNILNKALVPKDIEDFLNNLH